MAREAQTEKGGARRFLGLDAWIGFWFAVGCALRLTGLDVHSLWYDETISLAIGLADDPIEVLRLDHHPPLFYFVVRWWVELGGESDPWLRLLPALLSCVALALFARWLTLVAASASRVAMALFAVAPFQVWHGQELRAYPLLEIGVFCALIGGEYVLRDRSMRAALLVLAGQAIAFGVHYMGAMLLPAVGCVALAAWLTKRSTLGRATLLVVACAGGIVAWSPFLISHFAVQREAPWGHAVHLGWKELVELPVRHLLVENASVPMPWLAGLYALALVLLALWCWFLIVLARRRDPMNLAVAAVFFGTFLGVLGAVAFLRSGFQPKYLFVATPATAVMVALGAAAIPWVSARRAIVGFVIVGALLLSLWHKRANLREDYRSACAEVEASWMPGDAVVSITGTVEPFSSGPLRHFFRHRPDMLAAIVSETNISEVVQRVKREKARLHVVYREADYSVAPLEQVQRELASVEQSPNRYRIVRSLWKAPIQ